MMDFTYERQMGRISRGAFLTVGEGSTVNTMTIGWFQLGYFWNREVLTVGVRPSRFTHELLKQSTFYSVSIPEPHCYVRELASCGKLSGRDVDKIREYGLPLSSFGEQQIPYIAIPGEHLFGRIVFRTDMHKGQTDESLDRHYPEDDYHTLYFAELVGRIPPGS